MDVLVCRSQLDPRVWFTYATEPDGEPGGLDLIDFENPGGLRAVQRYAVRRYAGEAPTRWVRLDEDTYELVEDETEGD